MTSTSENGRLSNENTSGATVSGVQPQVSGLKSLGPKDSSPGEHSGTAGLAEVVRHPKSWNTADIGKRMAGDAVAAIAAGAMVAPVITVIDRAIIENASGRASLVDSLKAQFLRLLTRPHNFLTSRPFFLVFGLYTATYLSANSIDTVSSTLAQDPTASKRKRRASDAGRPDPRSPDATTAGTSKFLATSTANLSLCVYKDSQFAKLFGNPSAPKRPVGLPSLLLFGARDALTVFASFNLPTMIAPQLGALGFQRQWEQYMSRMSFAQFLAPAAVQVISTPLHLWGLDLYNRPNGHGETVTAGSRVAKVARDWGKSCAARVCRILPAFGVGGVVNTGVRRAWMERLPSAKTFSPLT